jgi:(E)-4-hydroxy-3-methylbut-2-enyl-diphosphate synthase
LGVTEAGEGEDGRVKSAMGIGTLLEDGLGDTVRVSLTEDPEFEAPVAKKIISRYTSFGTNESKIDQKINFQPYNYIKRQSTKVSVFGAEQLPKVIANFSNTSISNTEQLKPIGHHYLSATDKWSTNDTAADIIYIGSQIPEIELHSNIGVWCDYSIFQKIKNLRPCLPVCSLEEASALEGEKVLRINPSEPIDFEKIKSIQSVILFIESNEKSNYKIVRNFCFELQKYQIQHPIVFASNFDFEDLEQIQINASTDIGGLFVDGFGDGISVFAGEENQKFSNSLAFTILQASRVRMSKTEYISCPSCGRTLFNLQETTAMIRQRTDHLKGVKIGIMGCIVNGPGEMADADYGYVGSGVGKITLYKGQEVVKRSVNAENAVDELIEIIKKHGDWREPA